VTGEDILGATTVIYNLTNTEGIEEYDECAAWYAHHKAGTLDPNAPKKNIAYVFRILDLRNAPIFRPVPLSMIRIGSLCFVGFGGEAFTSYGQIMRELAPEKFVVCAVCANGYEDYLPTAEAFQQGGYEAKSSLFTPSLQQELVEAAEKLLKE
jgi:hypothetical protein